MKIKEFLKPTKGKIAITIVMFLILLAILLYTKDSCYSSTDNIPGEDVQKCHLSEVVTIFSPLTIIFWLAGFGLSDLVGIFNPLRLLVEILGLLVSIFYWYIISCTLIVLYRKNMKFFAATIIGIISLILLLANMYALYGLALLNYIFWLPLIFIGSFLKNDILGMIIVAIISVLWWYVLALISIKILHIIKNINSNYELSDKTKGFLNPTKSKLIITSILGIISVINIIFFYSITFLLWPLLLPAALYYYTLGNVDLIISVIFLIIYWYLISCTIIRIKNRKK